MALSNIFGIGLVGLGLALLFFFALPGRQREARAWRPIPAIRRLRRAIGLAVEDGKRLHISLGKANLLTPDNGSALTALSTLDRIARMSVVSDRPPVVTSGDGALAVLSQDTLQAAYRTSHALDQYDPDRGRLSGPTALSYVAGSLPVIRDEQVSTNILIGNFGPEVALMTEASEKARAFTLAASDSLAAQAVLYAAAEETLIGEELFAAPAYLQAGAAHQASLRVQDVLRWVLVALLILGALLKMAGVDLL